jgi:peroxiredoxin
MSKIVMRGLISTAIIGTVIVIAVGILQPKPSSGPTRSSSATSHAVGIQIGNMAPNFALLTFTGQKVQLSDYRGKVVMLNFWLTNCDGCRAEIPGMQKFYAAQQAAHKAFVILGVNAGDNGATTQQFVREHSITYPILLDSDLSVDQLYHVSGTPTSYFIDREGIIRLMTEGPIDEATLQQNIAQLNA